MEALEFAVDEGGDVLASEPLVQWAASSSWKRHWLYHRMCQEHYKVLHGSMPTPLGQVNGLAQRGFNLIPSVLDAGSCASVTKTIDDHMVEVLGPDGAPDTSQYVVPWTAYRAKLLQRVLPRILTDDITSLLVDYYGCEFQILAANLRRHYASGETDVSFTWHRDHEPGQQVHLIVYLNGASEETGRTDVLDLAATRKAAEAGYAFPPLEDRTNDLDRVFGGSAEGVELISPELEPGGGILLAASRALHRGRLPKTGWRDTLLLVFLPSPVPWKTRLAGNFNNILMNGQSLTAGLVDPFDRFRMSCPSAHGVPPDWAELGELYPPDGTPQ